MRAGLFFWITWKNALALLEQVLVRSGSMKRRERKQRLRSRGI
jgi:hypothetical protein